jgi:benzodiazapine receptor
MKLAGIKAYVVFISVCLIIGGLAALLTREGMAQYADLAKPELSPPPYVFTVVWTILYILMGTGAALIYNSCFPDRWRALTVFAIQLGVNFLWPLIFFGFGAYGWAFVWLLILLALAVIMILLYAKISRTAALLQLPYLIWLLFAGYLNLSVFLLNR